MLSLFVAVIFVCYPEPTNLIYQKSPTLKEQITSTGLLLEADDETLLVSTLDGALHAITKTSGALKWTLKEDPVIINPTDSSQQSVPRFFPNPQDGSLYRYTLGRNGVPLKKLPFTIPQLVANSPCRSSDGIFYLGKKVDSWVGVDMITGEKQLVLGMDQVDRKCPKPSRHTVYFGRTLYNIILYEGTTGNKWNISFFEYATTSSQALHDDYDLVHYTSTGEGSILTVDRNSGSVLWTLNLHSPLVALYLLGYDGNMMTVPVEMVSPQTLEQYTKEYMMMPYQASEGSLLIKKLNPTIYIGESDGSIYAIPALVDSNTVTISRQESQLLLGGPLGAQGTLKPNTGHHDKQKQQNQKNDVLLLGYYDMPENLETQLLKATPEDIYYMNDRIVPIGIVHKNDSDKSKIVRSQTHKETVSLIWDGVEQLKNLNTTFVSSGDILRWFGQITRELGIALIHEPVYIFIFIFTIGFTCIAIVLYRQAQEYARLNREWSSRRNWSRGSSSNSSKNGITATAEEQEDGTIRVGKILFDPHELLGKGCDGTFVFRGTFDSRSVAVKRVLPGCFSIADREVDLLRTSDQHPNVIRYFCMEQCSQFRYIALELCAATLEDLMAGRVTADISTLTILQQATSGLNHLHNLDIVHRDIKPHNILLSLPNSCGGVQVMISDFGLCKRLETGRMSFSKKSGVTGTEGWIAPEMMIGSSRPTCKVDIFSLGCVFYYMLTNGKHPFGSILDRQSHILSGKFRLEDLSRDRDIVQITLIEKMLSNKPSERPPTAALLLHPIFWTPERTLNFLQDVSDRTEKESPESAVVISLEHGGSEVIRNDWQQHLDPVIQADLRNFRNYKGHSIRDLLRAFRNKKNHYRELSDDARRVFGKIPDEFLKYWTSRFPRLLLHTWCAMHQLKQESIFAKYYHTDFDFIQIIDAERAEEMFQADYQQDMSSPAKNLTWRNQDNVRTEPSSFFDSLLKRGSQQRQPKKKEGKEEIPVHPRWVIRRPKNTFDPQFLNENTKDSEPQDKTNNGLSVIDDLRNEWFVNRKGTRVEPMSPSFLKSLNPLNNKNNNTAPINTDIFCEDGLLDSNKIRKNSGTDNISENEENVSIEGITEQVSEDLSCVNLHSEKSDLDNKIQSEKSDLTQEVQIEVLSYPNNDNDDLMRRDGSQLRFRSSIVQLTDQKQCVSSLATIVSGSGKKKKKRKNNASNIE